MVDVVEGFVVAVDVVVRRVLNEGISLIVVVVVENVGMVSRVNEVVIVVVVDSVIVELCVVLTEPAVLLVVRTKPAVLLVFKIVVGEFEVV